MNRCLEGISKLFQKIKDKIINPAVNRVFLVSLKNRIWAYFSLLKPQKIPNLLARENLKDLLQNPLFCVGGILMVILGLILLASNNYSKAILAKANSFQGNSGAILSPLLTNFVSPKEQLFFEQKQIRSMESPDLNIVQSNSLAAVSPSQAVSLKTLGAIFDPDYLENREEIVEYTVEPGDTLTAISGKFGISLNTILWANDLNKNSKISPGQKLIILPADGVIHIVKSGDTVGEIAKIYKGKNEEIIAFNELSSEADIYIGDILVVPNGVLPPKPQTIFQVPLASSYFIFPAEGKISQGLHWYNAVDIANKCGAPIYAAARGQVLKVKTTVSTSKWAFNGAGSHLTILHPNGVVTYYGHVSAVFVSPGEEVYQGQKIALMGGQPWTPGAGFSTGCHIHFGVSGAKNPLANYLLGALIQIK